VLAELGIDRDRRQVVEFGELIGGLQAGQFDMITAGMYINPERAEQILFSDPDYCIPSRSPSRRATRRLVDYQSSSTTPTSPSRSRPAPSRSATPRTPASRRPDRGVRRHRRHVPRARGRRGRRRDRHLATVQTRSPPAAASRPSTGSSRSTPTATRSSRAAATASPTRTSVTPSTRCSTEFREDGTTMEIITEYEDFTEEDVELANTLTVEDFLD
jgi:polar amino acid transport system substrate-binding protein